MVCVLIDKEQNALAEQPTIEKSKLAILPTLKGHMARLGSLMNFLFRNIDDEKYKGDLIIAVSEMQVLIKNSRQFKPDKYLLKIPDSDNEQALEDFQLCIKNASEKLDQLVMKISDEKDNTPDKPVLLELDLIRRNCHSKFG